MRGPYNFVRFSNNGRNVVLINPRKNNREIIETVKNCTLGRKYDTESEES